MRQAILLTLCLTLCLAGCANDQFVSQGTSPDGSVGVLPDGGPVPPVEDCFDGRDDDGNGKTDCQEPTCAPYAQCVPEPTTLPSGWLGYSSVTPDPACPPELPTAANVWEADDGQLRCPACQCTAQGNCGTSFSVAESIVAGCNPETPFTVDSSGGCQSVPPGAGGTGNHWAVANAGSGSCVVADAGPPTVGAAPLAARVCSAPRLGGGCPPGQVCAKRGAPGLCVSRPLAAGAPTQCPSEFPVTRLTVPETANPSAAFVDRRSCSPCSCGGAPSGGACTITLSLYSDSNCATLKGTVVSGSCSALSCGAACLGAKASVQYTPGTCTADGGAPSGAVELASPGTQYCCDQ